MVGATQDPYLTAAASASDAPFVPTSGAYPAPRPASPRADPAAGKPEQAAAASAQTKPLVGEVICEEDMECDDEPVSSVSTAAAATMPSMPAMPAEPRFTTLLHSKQAHKLSPSIIAHGKAMLLAATAAKQKEAQSPGAARGELSEYSKAVRGDREAGREIERRVALVRRIKLALDNFWADPSTASRTQLFNWDSSTELVFAQFERGEQPQIMIESIVQGLTSYSLDALLEKYGERAPESDPRVADNDDEAETPSADQLKKRRKKQRRKRNKASRRAAANAGEAGSDDEDHQSVAAGAEEAEAQDNLNSEQEKEDDAVVEEFRQSLIRRSRDLGSLPLEARKRWQERPPR